MLVAIDNTANTDYRKILLAAEPFFIVTSIQIL